MSCKRITVAKPLTARPANFKYNVCKPRITDIPRTKYAREGNQVQWEGRERSYSDESQL